MKVTVKIDNPINKDKMSIKLLEGMGWHTTYYPLFGKEVIFDENSITNAGIYTLVIHYDNILYYNEIVLYKDNPVREQLKFHFYQEGVRIFCRIKSDYAVEINKEVVLNEVDAGFNAIINSTNNV